MILCSWASEARFSTLVIFIALTQARTASIVSHADICVHCSSCCEWSSFISSCDNHPPYSVTMFPRKSFFGLLSSASWAKNSVGILCTAGKKSIGYGSFSSCVIGFLTCLDWTLARQTNPPFKGSERLHVMFLNCFLTCNLDNVPFSLLNIVCTLMDFCIWSIFVCFFLPSHAFPTVLDHTILFCTSCSGSLDLVRCQKLGWINSAFANWVL